jgi:hypothetical protein
MQAEVAMQNRHLTRRDALSMGAAVSVAAVVATGVPASALAELAPSADRQMRAGRVLRILSPRTAEIVAPDGSVTRVTLADDATILRGISGEVADLSAYVAGDAVVVIGSQVGSEIRASRVSSVYRRMSGEVLADHGSTVSTTAGALYLSAPVRARANAGVLGRGARFSAEIWDNPQTGHREAFIFRPASE